MSQQEDKLLEFCQKCQTLLLTKKDEAGAVLLKCPNCEYYREINGRHIIHSNKFKDDRSTKQVPYCTIYDSAVKRTTRISCKNNECPSLDEEQWGTETDRGIRVEPNVMIATVYDADRVSTYICRICGLVFRP
jgi:DNA-directed RNA polymerase subunit M/transcription elongation factor TFIIS